MLNENPVRLETSVREKHAEKLMFDCLPVGLVYVVLCVGSYKGLYAILIRGSIL